MAPPGPTAGPDPVLLLAPPGQFPHARGVVARWGRAQAGRLSVATGNCPQAVISLDALLTTQGDVSRRPRCGLVGGSGFRNLPKGGRPWLIITVAAAVRQGRPHHRLIAHSVRQSRLHIVRYRRRLTIYVVEGRGPVSRSVYGADRTATCWTTCRWSLVCRHLRWSGVRRSRAWRRR